MLLDVKHSKTIRVMSYKLTYANFSPKKYSPVHTLSVFRSISAVSGVKAWIFKPSQRNPQKQGDHGVVWRFETPNLHTVNPWVSATNKHPVNGWMICSGLNSVYREAVKATVNKVSHAAPPRTNHSPPRGSQRGHAPGRPQHGPHKSGTTIHNSASRKK